MDLERLASFEKTLAQANAEENIFARMGMVSALLSDLPAIIALARQQLEGSSPDRAAPASPPAPQ